MNIIRKKISVSTVVLTSADSQAVIRRILEQNIEIRNLQHRDDLTVSMDIKTADYDTVARIAEKNGSKILRETMSGPGILISRLFQRRFLLLGILFTFMFAWFLSARVVIVEVQGNQSVSARKILETASDCGIRFGATTRSVRSEQMKNKLLAGIPELQWAGVNTYGSRAVITVREKTQQILTTDQELWGSIVAVRDGIVLSCTVTSGTAAVAPGQAVSEGQVLISGVGEDALSVHSGTAEGEVIAQTRRELTLKTCMRRDERGAHLRTKRNYSLVIGKKRINFYKGSGISDAGCVKMYSEYVLTLPGGFSLPVRFLEEVQITCERNDINRDDERAMSSYASAYLRSQMIAGVITGASEQVVMAGDCMILMGIYECQEMIGRVKPGEIGVYHGKTD